MVKYVFFFFILKYHSLKISLDYGYKKISYNINYIPFELNNESSINKNTQFFQKIYSALNNFNQKIIKKIHEKI